MSEPVRATASLHSVTATASIMTISPISVPAAIVIGLISSFIQSLGLTIQRKSHIQNAQLPVDRQRGEWSRPAWVTGFGIFLVANIGGTVFQIGALPIVMLAPLGAVSLLYNALLARFILDDFFSKYMVVGTLLIAAGAVLIGYFGVVQEPTHSLDDLLALYARPTFVVFASLFALVFVGVLAIAHLAEWQLHIRLFRPASEQRKTGKLPKKKRKPMQRRWSAPSLAPVAEVSESSSGIATPVLAIADEAARRGIPVERVLVQRGPKASSPIRQQVQQQQQQRQRNGAQQRMAPKSQPDYGATNLPPNAVLATPTRARGSSSSSTYTIASLDDIERQSTSAAALTAAEHDPAIRKICLSLAVTYGGASGTLSGACLLLAKSGVELLVLTIAGDNQFDRWQSWFLVGVMLLAALLQLWYLNKSLRLASPPLVCPLAFCFYNTSSIALGLVYFNQLDALSATSIALVVVGIVVLLAGVWIVSLHGAADTDECDKTRVEVDERQPLLSDRCETTASPTSSPLSPTSTVSQKVVQASPTETGGLLANAGGIAGPHLPVAPVTVVVDPVNSPELMSPKLSPDKALMSPDGKIRAGQRRRSGSGSAQVGGLGLHMPGLPLHPRPAERGSDDAVADDEEGEGEEENRRRPGSPLAGPSSDGVNGQDDHVQAPSPRRRSFLPHLKLRFGNGGSPSTLLSPSRGTKRRGLYDSLLERGLSIGISPSSPGFHVGSIFEFEPDVEDDSRKLWRSRLRSRRTFSENDTSMTTERLRQAPQHASVEADVDEGGEGGGDEADVSDDVDRSDDAASQADEDQRSINAVGGSSGINNNSSAWMRVIPTLDSQALNDRLRKIKTDAGDWFGYSRS